MQRELRYEDVERRNLLSPTELFEQYMKPRKPVVITGASVWKGGEPFTPGYLKSRYGHLRIDQLRHAEGGFNTHSAETILRVPTLGHLLEDFEDAGSCDLPYLINLSIPLNFPELMPYLGAQEYASPNWLRKGLLGKAFNQRGLADGEMFLGPRSTGYPVLHFDVWAIQVISYQLYGQKRWWLFPPEEAGNLYAMPRPNDWYPHHSPVNPDEPDLVRYPRFANAKGYSTVIQPGELMLVPSYWWHGTKNETAAISTAVRIVNSCNASDAFWDFCRTEFINRLASPYFKHR